MLLIHPNTINLTHKGSASVSVIVKWLVLVKIYGNNPRKLLNRIRENNDTNKKVLPLLIFFPPSKVLNSLCSFVNSVFHRVEYRDGINHILVGISSSPRKVLTQFKDKLKFLVDGSNTENRFLIIFNLIVWLGFFSFRWLQFLELLCNNLLLQTGLRRLRI